MAAAARTSAQSVRSAGKVSSRPCERATHGSPRTSTRPSPRPSCTYQGPNAGPRSAASAAGSAAASSATVCRPRSASFAAVLAPMPQSARVGRCPITSAQFCAVRVNRPPGLPNSVAIFARSRLSPIPTAQVRRVSAVTAAWIRLASSSAAASSATVVPTNASSHPMTSTVTPSNRRSTAMTCSDAASYAGLSAGQEHGVGAAGARGAQRHAGPDAVLPRDVGRGGDDAAPGRVPVPADHHRALRQLRAPQDLDRRDELVEIDVQHPVHGAA